jgi:20S proteasome alpha/beta subunit
VYSIDEYRTMGSGADLAKLVMKQLNRSMEILKGSLNILPTKDLVRICCYIIGEVKESDRESGGTTKVVVLDSSGVRELPDDEVQSNYKAFVAIEARLFSKLFEGSGLSQTDIGKMFPNP